MLWKSNDGQVEIVLQRYEREPRRVRLTIEVPRDARLVDFGQDVYRTLGIYPHQIDPSVAGDFLSARLMLIFEKLFSGRDLVRAETMYLWSRAPDNKNSVLVWYDWLIDTDRIRWVTDGLLADDVQDSQFEQLLLGAPDANVR